MKEHSVVILTLFLKVILLEKYLSSESKKEGACGIDNIFGLLEFQLGL
jgi:hypothetical protein